MTGMDSCQSSKIGNCTPRPELCPFPESSPCLCHLFLSPPTAPLIAHCQPTKFTRLRSSTHTRPASAPVGVATTYGDGVASATTTSAPPPVFAPHHQVPPRAVAVAGHQHDRRADDKHRLCTGATPASRRRPPLPSLPAPSSLASPLQAPILLAVPGSA